MKPAQTHLECLFIQVATITNIIEIVLIINENVGIYVLKKVVNP